MRLESFGAVVGRLELGNFVASETEPLGPLDAAGTIT